MPSGLGNGTTLAITGGSVVAYSVVLLSLNGSDLSLPAIDDTNLSSTNTRKYRFGKLVDGGSISGTMEFDTDSQAQAKWLTPGTVNSPQNMASVTATVTYSKTAGYANAAKLSGTGNFTRLGTPSASDGSKYSIPFTFQFDGVTGPTFTEEKV